jgi:hypothetical protein
VFRLQLTIPVMAPLRPQSEEGELYAAALTELRNLANLPTIDPAFSGAQFSIQVLNAPEDEPLLAGNWKAPYGVRTYALLKFAIDATACVESLRRESEWKHCQLTEKEKERLLLEISADYFEHEVDLFLLAANIVRPGALSAIKGYAFVGHELISTTKPFFAESFYGAVRASKVTGWPKLLSPSVVESWSWLQRSQAVVDGIGVRPLGRALSALSHLTREDLSTSSSVDLFWLLLGLEALYARGNVGLKEQLLGKTEVILGPRTENKKLFGTVYDFRSRLLHGDVDVPLRFSQFDAVEKFERFHEELDSSEELALAA